MRISTPERRLREIALDPKASPKDRVAALQAMVLPSVNFLRALLNSGDVGTGRKGRPRKHAGAKPLPAKVILAASVMLSTTRLVLKNQKHVQTPGTLD